MKTKTLLLTFMSFLISSLLLVGCSYGTLDPLKVPEKTFTLSVLEGETATFTPPDSGISSSTTYIVTYPGHGSAIPLDNNTPGVEYTADSGFSGTDTFVVDFLNSTEGDVNSSLPYDTKGYRYTVTVNVKNVNEAPLISGVAPSQAIIGQPYSFAPVVLDYDQGDTLNVSVSGTPSWMSYNPSTYTISGTPPRSSGGQDFVVTYVASDGILSSELKVEFTVVPQDGTSPSGSLSLSGEPAVAAKVGVLYSFVPTVINKTGEIPVFSVEWNPSWLHVNASTGELSGTPSSSDVGVVGGIILTAKTSQKSAELPGFNIITNE